MKRIFQTFFLLLCSLGLAAGGAPAQAGPAAAPKVEYSMPRDYGYFLGDPIEVSYTLMLSPEHFLRPGWSSPGRGESGEGVEIRESRSQEWMSGGRRVYRLTVVYQAFLAPEIPQWIEIPSRKFFFGPSGNLSAFSSDLPSIPVMVSPLTSAGDRFQPPILQVWESSYADMIRRTGFGLLLAGALLWALFLRERFRRPSPFRTVSRRLARETDPSAALVLFRGALNEKAGQAVFPRNLEDFFQSFPPAQKHRREIEDLVRISEEVLFNPAGEGPRDLISRISGLTGKLARAETWA